MTQNDFNTTISNTIKYLLDKFDDNHSKQDAKFKEAIEEAISEQDEKLMKNSKAALDLVTSDQRQFYQVFIKTECSKHETLLRHNILWWMPRESKHQQQSQH